MTEKKNIKKLYSEKIQKLIKFNKAYFEKDNPIVTDEKFDELKKELFEIVKKNLPKNIQITHQSLFDKSIEGIKLKSKPVFSVQYHPESNPGPQDSVYLFEEFVTGMKKYAKKKRY